MHSPKPYGFSVEGGVPTQNDYNLILQLVRHLSNTKQLSNLESLKIVRDLPDGGTVIVRDMGGILKVIVKKPSKFSEPFNGIAKMYIPMFYSGVFRQCWYRDHEKYLPLKITEQCRKRLSSYGELKVEKDISLERFAIEYDDKFHFLKPKIEGSYFRHSQYMRLKPTLYSGPMAELVQIVSGYGKLHNENYKVNEGVDELPTAFLENAEMDLPDKWYVKVLSELKNSVLPGYTGMPEIEGKIQYDYRPQNNTLVSFDSNKKPWLIQVGFNGVYAMPLPIVPATATPSFKEYIESVADEEILKILDRFGALPSGETFPKGEDFQNWERAGAIIKVCESSDFYNNNPMYGSCGWSMNSSGTEAFNTCYTYLDNGLMTAYGYKLKLKLGSATNEGWIAAKQTDMSSVYRYVADLFKLLSPGTGRSNAIIYKVRQSKVEDLAWRADLNINGVGESEVDYWHNMQMEPIAKHSGNMARVTSGSVYWPAPKNPTSMGRFKFPTYSGEGCESLVMISPEYEGDFVRCDTVIFGTYIDDQLRYVKYFYDERKVTESVNSTFEDGMIVGSWEESKTNEQSGLLGHFYTTDADDRRLASPSSSYTKIVGTDLGYGNPAYGTPSILYTHGGLSRSRYYKHVTTIDTISGDGMDCAVCIPNFNRDCILYAFQESTQSKSHNEKHNLYAMADPTSYELWTYDPIFHWIGGSGKGKPAPTTGDYVYVYGPKYNPTKYSDFADSGDWYGVGSGYIDVSAICAPYTDRASGAHHAGGVAIGGEGPTIEPFDKTTHESNILKGRVDFVYDNVGAKVIHRNLPALWYFQFSPVDSGGSLVYFQRDACRVLFGETEYANISDENASPERRQRWGYSTLADSRGHHYFFGVINE